MKDLLTLTQLNNSQIRILLGLSADMKRITQSLNKKSPQLMGKILLCLADDDYDFSTYELAFQYLGGQVVVVKNCADMVDTARKFANYGVNMIAVKCNDDTTLYRISEKCSCHIFNVATRTASPVSSLSILATLSYNFDTLTNKKITFFGYKKANIIKELVYFLRIQRSAIYPFYPYDDGTYGDDMVLIDELDHALLDCDAIIDLGADKDIKAYYGNDDGLSDVIIDKAKAQVVLLGNRYYMVKGIPVEYPYNLVDRQEQDYIASCMALMYYVLQ